MKTRIFINGREVSNPVVSTLLIPDAVIIAAVAAALVIFVLFPVIGIAVTLSFGVIAIFVVAIMMSIAALVLITVIYSWLFGSAEFRFERYNRR